MNGCGMGEGGVSMGAGRLFLFVGLPPKGGPKGPLAGQAKGL